MSIKLTLDDQQAWFLHKLLEDALEVDELFITTYEDSDDQGFDQDYHTEIDNILSQLHKKRFNKKR